MWRLPQFPQHLVMLANIHFDKIKMFLVPFIQMVTSFKRYEEYSKIIDDSN